MKRTDLALEIRESIEGDDKEVRGVVLDEKLVEEERIRVTKVLIRNKKGEMVMGKPMGTYITLELMGNPEDGKEEKLLLQSLKKTIAKYLKKMILKYMKEEGGQRWSGEGDEEIILVAGLGNREATPDSLGPRVVKHMSVRPNLCAVSPGVMAQTGMETYDILTGIVEKIKPAVLVVVDALAARNTSRLMRTVQITDTGICPGAGIGNHRKALNKENVGIPVIAVGVPTVVDAETIVENRMEDFLVEQGFSQHEIEMFLKNISENIQELFVTPKDIDETIEKMSVAIAGALNDMPPGIKEE